MYVYLTTNLINGKKYIGQHIGNVNDNYLGSGKLLKEDIKKFGRKSFSKEILCICSNSKELDQKERFYIEKYNAVYSDEFYNIAEGGAGGNKILGWSEERLEEYKEKQRIASTGKNNGMYGRKHSEETKQKIRENKSYEAYKTSEYRKKQSELNKGEKNGNFGNIGEKAKNGKKIIMKDKDGNILKVFNTVRMVLDFLKIKGHSCLYKAIKNNKEYHGYYWEKEGVTTNDLIE